jgi:hypothetical protein
MNELYDSHLMKLLLSVYYRTFFFFFLEKQFIIEPLSCFSALSTCCVVEQIAISVHFFILCDFSGVKKSSLCEF